MIAASLRAATRLPLICILFLAAPRPASPDTDIQWIGGNGNFSDGNNWTNGIIPGTLGKFTLTNADIQTSSPVKVTFDWEEGLLSFNQLFIGLSAGLPGQTDTLLIPANALQVTNEVVGALGVGAINQSNGLNTITNILTLGNAISDTGSYTLSGGAVNAGTILLGNSGTGSFSQSAGTTTVNSTLVLGLSAGASGSLTLLGTGSLVSAVTQVGFNGTGSVEQSGGTFSTGSLSLAQNAGSNGTYSLDGGSLAVSNGSEYVGFSGTASVTQTGGFNTLGNGAGAENLVLGSNAGSIGTYNLTGVGSLSVTGANLEYIGDAGFGAFTQNGISSHTVSTFLVLGNQSTGSGSYTLTQGTLSAGTSEIVGNLGAGTFEQDGGSNTSAGLVLANSFGSTGSYTLTNGTLSLASTEYVGDGGNGSFVQSGGSNTIASTANGSGLHVGVGVSGNGTYELDGGSLKSFYELVGENGTGAFTQTSGVNTATAQLALGVNAGSTGQYTLTGGSLTTAEELIGDQGFGTFTQTGGTHTVSGPLVLSAGPGGIGFYNLSGGSLSANFALIGEDATGVLNISGGSLSSPNSIAVFNTPGSAINFTGGTITAPSLSTGGNPSLFNWTGGTLNLTTSVILDATDKNTWTGGVFGPSLTLNNGQTLSVTGDEVIGTTGGFALTLNDGSANTVTGSIAVNTGATLTVSADAFLSYTNLVQAGGTISGTLTNSGNFGYTSGQFNGRLVNQGTVSLGSNFTAGNGIENDTTLNVATGQTLTVNGAGLDNFGTVTMTGGRIAGNGGVLNDIGAVMNVSGAASIAPAFTNYGQLNVNGLLTLSGGGHNFGAVTVGSASSIRGASSLINEGAITLAGGGISMASTGNAAGGVISGTGSIGGSFANSAGGIMQVAAGNTLTITNSWVNEGLVTMSGGTLGGTGIITSSGVMQGSGIVAGAVANSGTVRASGGELEIAGAGSTNQTGAQIQVQSGATVLYVQGLAENDGTIALSGGTFDNANAALLNTGNIVGSGTIRTGGLTNEGNMSFADAATGVFGNIVTQNPGGGGGNITVTNATATFFGQVTLGENTTFTVDQGAARFLAGFVDNGTYVSDPSTSSFTNLTIDGTGELIGGSDDTFLISGNFINDSTESDSFDIDESKVGFTGSGVHMFDWIGADEGALYQGALNNFGIGTVEVASGAILDLSDASDAARTSAGLYVGTLLLDGTSGDTSAQLAAFITSHLVNTNASDVLDIYYDPQQVGNDYLEGETYSLGGGGLLAPLETAAAAPEPRFTGLLLALAAGFVFQRHKKPSNPVEQPSTLIGKLSS